MIDFHVRPRELASVAEVAQTLGGSCQYVLVGDHGGSRSDYPPSFMAAEILRLGLSPWVTLSCRDRNRVSLGAECAALAALGVARVHCVTGDWQGAGGDMAETRVFDLDALRLIDLARSYGLKVSVAATPSAPPVTLRPARLAEKVRAGAEICFVNHSGGARHVAEFIVAAQGFGADIDFLPCVPVVSDPASVAALSALPGLVIDNAVVARVRAAPNSQSAGVRAALAEAQRMIAIEGVVGINLSGAASTLSEVQSATIMADIGRQIRSGTASSSRERP